MLSFVAFIKEMYTLETVQIGICLLVAQAVSIGKSAHTINDICYPILSFSFHESANTEITNLQI